MLENLSFQDILEEPKFKDLYVFNKWYIYKAINATKTDKFFSPNKHKVLFLKDEQEINLITDSIRVYPVSTNITNQDSQAQTIVQMKQGTFITDFIADVVPENTFYVISETRIETEKIVDFSRQENKIYFVDFASGSDFKFHKQIKGTEDWQKKVRIIATLKQVQTYNQTLNSRTFVFHSKKYVKLALNQVTNKLDVVTKGLLGRINVVESYIDNNLIYQRDFTSDKNNLILQADANQVNDMLNLICSTFDKTRFMPLQFLKIFFNKKTSLKELWSLNGFSNEFPTAQTKPTAATDLYKAMLTILFFSKVKLTDFQGYRIIDLSSPNYNKIDIDKISKFVYGVVATENLTLNIEELNAHIIAYWEQKWNIELAKNSNLKDMYDKLKIVLLMSGTDVPSPYSFGSYDDINKMVADFYTAIDFESFNFETGIPNLSDISCQVFSEKYEIASSGTIDVKNDLKVLSRTNVVDLRNSYSLPQIPKRFVAKDKNTRPQNADLTTNELFSYWWFLNVKDQTTFLSSDAKVFSDWVEISRNVTIVETIKTTVDLIDVPAEGFEYQTTINYSRPSELSSMFGSKPTTQTSLAHPQPYPNILNLWTSSLISSNASVKQYVLSNLIQVDYEMNNSISPKVQISNVTDDFANMLNPIGSLKTGTGTRTYVLTFSWQQRLKDKTQSPAISIKFPYNINVNTWRQFLELSGDNLDPTFSFNFKSSTRKTYVKELTIFGTLESENYSVTLYGVLPDGTIDTTPIPIEWPSNFQDDQSIIENGLIF